MSCFSGENRIQIRIQEWAKKLHPDGLRNRLRNFRRYVISATTEKRNSTLNSRGEDPVPTATSHLPTNCDNTMSSTRCVTLFDVDFDLFKCC